MLEKERFLAIKKLARDIRKDNREFFNSLINEPVEVAASKKDEFVDKIMNNMSSAFGIGEQGKEEKQIFKANILIPDDREFYESYSNDKNIRNLMNKYGVNIENVMSKITELNIYGKYIDSDEEPDFVDEMVKITPKEAEDLLDEIDSLSNTLTDLDLSSTLNEPTVEKTKKEEVKKTENKAKKEKPIEEPQKKAKVEIEKPDFDDSDDFLGDSFENINNAISGFIVDFNKLKADLKDREKEIRNLNSKLQDSEDENEKLKAKNLDNEDTISKIKSDNADLKSSNAKLNAEITKLNKRMKVLEDKLYKSATLLRKVYNGIQN